MPAAERNTCTAEYTADAEQHRSLWTSLNRIDTALAAGDGSVVKRLGSGAVLAVIQEDVEPGGYKSQRNYSILEFKDKKNRQLSTSVDAADLEITPLYDVSFGPMPKLDSTGLKRDLWLCRQWDEPDALRDPPEEIGDSTPKTPHFKMSVEQYLRRGPVTRPVYANDGAPEWEVPANEALAAYPSSDFCSVIDILSEIGSQLPRDEVIETFNDYGHVRRKKVSGHKGIETASKTALIRGQGISSLKWNLFNKTITDSGQPIDGFRVLYELQGHHVLGQYALVQEDKE